MAKQLRKLTTDKIKVYGNVFDEFTLRTIFKLSAQGHFAELKSPIALGKEANVFSAIKDDGTLVAVKIYRVQSCDFGKMFDYIKSDPRYYNIKKTKRNIIFSWVQREFRNLTIARQAGVRVPLPIAFKNNVLVIEYLGVEDNLPAPKLVNTRPDAKKKIFEDVVKNMKKLYKAGLVHADLSPFNILLKDEKPYLIDFSQATPLNDIESDNFLIRDVKNVCNFFRKLGMKLNDIDILKIILEK